MINFNVYRSNRLPALMKKLQQLNKSHALVGILASERFMVLSEEGHSHYFQMIS